MARVPQGRVILGGTLSGGVERWTMSFAMDPLNARSQSQLDALAEDIGTLFASLVFGDATLDDRISSATAFTDVRIDDVQDPGGVVRTASWVRSEPLVGASAFQQLPPQCSHVISLRTTLPGPRFRGRMYFPPLSAEQLTNTGELAGSACTDLSEAMAAFFNGFNSSSDIAGTAFVASDAAQQLTAVTALQVGSTIDTQRRRRDAVPESYYEQTITP